MSHQGRESTDT